MKIEAKNKYPYFQVFIDDLVHLQFIKSKYIAHESYKEGKNKYIIEYYLKGKDILCEYNDFEKWESILKLLEINL